VKPLSIRTSLTLWFVGLTGLLLGALSVTLYLGMRDTLVAALDARLQTRAEAVVALCEWEKDAPAVEFEIPEGTAAEFASRERGAGIEVRTWPDGDIVYAAGVTLAAPVAVPRGVSLGFLDGDRTRVCAVRRELRAAAAETDGSDVVVRVAEGFAPVVEQLRQVRALVLLLTAIAAAVVCAFGLLLSRRFVRPLRRLGEAAAAVDAATHTPMPRRGTCDEVDRLAAILDRTFASLREAMERKARFTADAAHELRNPVSVIRNAAEVALRPGRSEQDVRQFLHDILATSGRMGDVVQSLLVLARMDAKAEPLTMEEVDLAEVVRDAVATCPDGRARITLHDEAPAPVRGDRGLLRVLVDNLVGNALQHSEGARVDVRVASDADGGVTLQVRDHGPGVPLDAQHDVFLRFYRARAPAKVAGAGLGLAIVAEVAAAHGATCRLENVHPGARVTVVFPGPGVVQTARPGRRLA